MATKKSTKKKVTKKPPRSKAVYPKLEVRKFVGDKPLTAVLAKKILGWEVECGKAEFGSDFLLRDGNNQKVRCVNNVGNRIYKHHYTKAYAQDILHGRWMLNGHNRIVGKEGNVLSGQHVFPALVLAVQAWENDPQKYEDCWKTEPTIETLIVFGIEESDDVKNTIDTARASTMTDVLFRSEYFADLHVKDRKVVARMADYCIKMLWHRTGASADAFTPYRTHSESLDFLERHPTILKCVKHVFEENAENKITQVLAPGYASALLYLMASSETDPLEYRETKNPSEEQLDNEWTHWDKACEYWVCLAGNESSIQPVRKAIADLLDEEGASVAQRCAILIKGWNQFVDDRPITAKTIALEYETDPKTGFKTLSECPSIGGIDYGDPANAQEPIPNADPTPAEIKERSAAEQEQTAQKKAAKKAPVKKAKKKAKKKKPSKKSLVLVGKVLWVAGMGEMVEPFRCKVMDVQSKTASVEILQGFQGAGNTIEVPVDFLQEKQPQA